MKKKLDLLLNNISNRNTIKKPIFKKVDYDEYYSYLSTLPLNKVKESIAYYDGAENSFFTGIMSALFLAILFYISQQDVNIIRELISKNIELTNKEIEIIFKGYLSVVFVLIIISIFLFIFLYKQYRNRKYEINIQKAFLKDKEGEIFFKGGSCYDKVQCYEYSRIYNKKMYR